MKKLILFFVFTGIFYNANAQITVIDTGVCGVNLTWTLTSDSTLTINGRGAMSDYISDNGGRPWDSYKFFITDIIIENGITSIGEHAFYHIYNLCSITIPNSVITIGSNSFENCTSLITIEIPNSVLHIGNNVFFNCRKLLSIHVDSNNSNYSSNSGVLYNKEKDTLIRFPAGKADAFTIPNTVVMIADYAFHSCQDLTSVIIPNSVITIAYSAFGHCYALTSVEIGESVTSIASFAFFACRNLDTIICKAKFPPSIGDQVTTFNEVSKRTALVYIPCGTLWNYQMSWIVDDPPLGLVGFSNYIEEEGDAPAVPLCLSVETIDNEFVLAWHGKTNSYNIYRNNQFIATVNTNTYTDTDLKNGVDYCYKVQAAGEDCWSDASEEICMKFNYVGIVETKNHSSLHQIYPNPAQTHFTVTNTKNTSLQLYDITGQEVLHIYSTQENTNININCLPQGMYVLKITKEGVSSMHIEKYKLIKN